jgi:DNA repair protein RecO (recombination protein O)
MTPVEDAGFVLHRRPWQESSALLDVLTRHHGRVGLLAKGVQGPRARLKGVLQPFVPLQLQWAGRGELPLLRQAQESAAGVLLSGQALYCALYLNELTLRLLARQDPHPGVFEAYSAALAAQSLGPAPAALRLYERDLLHILGYGLLLTHCADGVAVQADDWYDYHMEHGLVAAAAASSDAIAGRSLLALAAGRLDDPADLYSAKRLLRRAVEHHAGRRGIKSRELFSPLLKSA